MSKTTKSKGAKGQTPLMKQYFAIKERHPGTILLFRMGDFYETFDEDAKIVHDTLGITLTKRSNGQAADVLLAGFPHHAIDNYLPKLVQAGLRVAICEQLEDPKAAKGIVKRDVVEVVTPGVSFRDQLLEPKRAQYVAAFHRVTAPRNKDIFGVSFADVSTGEFFATEVDEESYASLLGSISPSELLVESALKTQAAELGLVQCLITGIDDWVLQDDYARDLLTNHFDTHSLKGFGVDDMTAGLIAAGAVLHYLQETQKNGTVPIRQISRLDVSAFMMLDQPTRQNLELISSKNTGTRDGSLIEILDETRTPMGGRLLRAWLLRPLRTVEAIRERQELVESIHRDHAVIDSLQECFDGVGDLERIAAKVATRRISPRDLIYLRETLKQIPYVREITKRSPEHALVQLGDQLLELGPLVDQIQKTVVDEPPPSLKNGGVIRKGHDQQLDEVTTLASSGKEWLTELQTTEAERTGISSLKVGFNKVFGYYLEVTNTHKDRVPGNWIRKQTLVNAERYITQELKEYEERIINAENEIREIEHRIFDQLISDIETYIPDLQKNAHILAQLDVFTSLAFVAHRFDYVKPGIDDSTRISIREGRHPVVERLLPVGEPFIPNDIELDSNSDQILLITGPNMAGKSVVLRQVGLIVLMAQFGSFVPASEATVGIVDRIFTRVGASDNLAAGESTFLVEMNETANILNSATPRSLILLDEVGRGTSTFDGLSIAWALVEHLHDQPSVAARTLFATHYHELNELSGRLSRVRNYRIQVREHKGRIIFLRKLVTGGADHSYGVEVARMAGIPNSVLVRARTILQHLESQQIEVEEAGLGARSRPIPQTSANQMSLFKDMSDPVATEIRERIESIDPDQITPIEALVALSELKDLTKES